MRTALLAISLALLGCTPVPPAPEHTNGDGVARHDASAPQFNAITVHIAGYKGSGLSLTIDGLQMLPVPSDGIWKVALTAPSPDIELSVVTQPIDPEQVCDVTKPVRHCATTAAIRLRS